MRCLQDMLHEAKVDDPVIGRYKEIKQIIAILSSKDKSNVMLVGDPGVGKTALVECLAKKIAEGDVPEDLKNHRLLSLNVGALLKNTKYRGELEDNFESFMKEVKKGGTIVFIDEIHLVIGAGQVADSNLDFSNLLKPYLARKGSKVIGATTVEEYNKYVCSDPAFERRFQKVEVGEPNNIDATNILRGLKNVLEKDYRVEITDAALIAAVEYSSRYITERKLPDKAIELLHEACTCLKLQLDGHPEVISALHDKINNLKLQSRALKRQLDPASRARYIEVIKETDASERELQALLATFEGEEIKLEDLHFFREYREKYHVEYEKLANKECAQGVELIRKIGVADRRMKEIEGSMMLVDKVGPNEIAKAVSRRTGIPVTKIGADERKKLETLADKLNAKVIGQEQAVGPVVDSVITFRAGLGRKDQPTASFLFCGPPGVGKTQLAKALAEELFGDQSCMVRLDMSGYKDANSVMRLIGPYGLRGAAGGAGGDLTGPVRRRPYSVVLLDEIEKADTSVHNLLLQLLDEGRLTDSQGRDVSFANTVVILTSNLGTQHFVDAIAGNISMDQARSMVIGTVKSYFSPEFVNRVDQVIVFNPVSRDNALTIGRLLSKDAVARAAAKGIGLQITDGALERLLSVNFNEVEGARRIKKMIEHKIVTQLAKMVVSGEITENSSTVLVHSRAEEGKLGFLVRKYEGGTEIVNEIQEL